MSIYSYLHKDHERVKKSMREIEHLDLSDENIKSLFNQLKKELKAHLEATEKVFYARLKKYDFLAESIERAKVEIQAVYQKLDELSDDALGEAEWHKRFLSLKQLLEGHFKKEEHEFFPMVAAVLDIETGLQMKNDMETEKARIRKTFSTWYREPSLA